MIAAVIAVVIQRAKDADSRWEGGELYVRGCGVSKTGRLEQIVMIVTEGRIQPATKWRINNNEPKESV